MPHATLNHCGSEWHCWDPHVHAPGTLFNDQFGGDWETFLQKLESTNPTIRALGVTVPPFSLSGQSDTCLNANAAFRVECDFAHHALDLFVMRPRVKTAALSKTCLGMDPCR